MKEELAGIITEEEVGEQLATGGRRAAGAGGSKEEGDEAKRMEQLDTRPANANARANANDVGARVDLDNGEARDGGGGSSRGEGVAHGLGPASAISLQNFTARDSELDVTLNRLDENGQGRLGGGSAGSPASETTLSDGSPSQQGNEKWVLDHVPPPIKVRREGECSEETTPQDLSPPSPKRMRELSRKGAIHDLPFSKVFSHPSI